MRSIFYVHLDVPATRIPPGQITDYTRNPTKTAPIEHPKNFMETIMEPFRTRDIANPGRTLTKDTTDRDTLWDRRMNDLLIRINRQIESSTACSGYPCIEASTVRI